METNPTPPTDTALVTTATPVEQPPEENLGLIEAPPSYLATYMESGQTGEEIADQYAKSSATYLKIVQGTGPLSAKFDKGVVLRPDETIFMDRKDVVTVTPIFIFPQFNLCYDYRVSPDKMIKETTIDPNSELAKKCEPWSKAARQIPDPDHQGDWKCTFVRAMIHVVYCFETEELVFLTMASGEDETFREWRKLRKARGDFPIFAGRYEMSVSVHPKTFKSQFNWMGFDFKNAATPWNNRATMDAMFEFQKKAQMDYDARKLGMSKDQANKQFADNGEDQPAPQF